ncbi:MAG: DUF4212 domain-containing protein [Gammaproteobacteria bacterium]|nr:DUF4212 domain-containing protein [Gammaproteobacteria bacterium]
MKNPSYWKDNLKLVGILLSVWFVVSFVCGILLVDLLNHVRVGGFKLGFWFAQQGSIFVFVILVFVYAHLAKKLDRKHGVEEQ